MLKWGARIDPTMHKNTLKVMIVMSGMELAKYVEETIQQSSEQPISTDDLGIDEIDGY